MREEIFGPIGGEGRSSFGHSGAREKRGTWKVPRTVPRTPGAAAVRR